MNRGRIAVTDYAAGAQMPRHRDDRSRLTIVLSGGFCEETPRAAAVAGPADIVIKPRDEIHENRFGPSGARLATVLLYEEDFGGDDARRWQMRRRGEDLAAVLTLVSALLHHDDAAIDTALADILASGDEERRRTVTPRWLRSLREEIAALGLSGVDVAERAKAAGVHPVHASRAFSKTYGQSITAFAQTASVRRAFTGLTSRAPLSEVAVDAGFYDQSHMCRVFRRVLGRPPAAVRTLVAG